MNHNNSYKCNLLDQSAAVTAFAADCNSCDSYARPTATIEK